MRVQQHYVKPETKSSGQPHRNAATMVTELRFRRLLNDLEWARLPQTIKRRFSEKLPHGKTKNYRGRILETKMNLAGKFLSRIMVLLGGSLPLDTDNSGASALVSVSPYNNENGFAGQLWTRQYTRKSRLPQIIQSHKQFSGPTGLEEFLGQGIGMTLKLKVTENSLLFIAEQYFIEVFGRRIYLPKVLSPGALTISHINQSENSFIFGMKLVHPWFGQLVSQNIMFKDLQETK